MKKRTKNMTPAMSFIILLGIVSMFSDMTHEGATSIRGAYLYLLGASASTIGFVSGLGELVGYSLRYVFGIITDKTKKYRTMTIVGYIIDVLAVPALALVGKNGWVLASILLVVERTGKAMKKPAKNTIMSFAAKSEGAGKSFAIQEALDQLGAFLGPLFLYFIMLFKTKDTLESYRLAYLFLAIPAFLTIAFLLFAKRKFPHPEDFEKESEVEEKFVMKPSFVSYIFAISLFAFGFIDFSLITMHVSRSNLISENALPLIYAFSMLIDALSALYFGMMYDKKGIKALITSTIIASTFSLFVFGINTKTSMIIGLILWGIGMGAEESIFKAVVTNILPKENRARGYGIFEFSFGVFWFLGSWLMGVMYERSIIALIAISIIAQLLSIPLYILSDKKRKAELN